MNILLMKGKDNEMRLPASQIFLITQQRTLEEAFKDLSFDVAKLKAYPPIAIDDSQVSSDKVYSSNKIVSLINNLINDETISANSSYSSSKISDIIAILNAEDTRLSNKTISLDNDIENIYNYINKLYAKEPEIILLELESNNKIKIALEDFINNSNNYLDTVKNSFSISIDGNPLTISNIEYKIDSYIDLSNATLTDLEIVNNELQIEGW